MTSAPGPNPFAHARHSVFGGRETDGPPTQFPFERALSLAGVIAHWEELASRDPAADAAAWADLRRDLSTAPELFGCIEDAAVLGRRTDLIARLIRPIFPTSDWTNEAKGSGLTRYFKLTADTRFVNIEARGEIPVLDPTDVDELLNNVRDLEIWKRKLPPHLFRFVGVTVVNHTDVTVEIATAAITHLVLSSDANVTEHNFDSIEQDVRNLFGNGGLRMGLASLQADGELNVGCEGVYGRALREGHSVMLRDVGSGDVRVGGCT